jgi:hypothetical protein
VPVCIVPMLRRPDFCIACVALLPLAPSKAVRTPQVGAQRRRGSCDRDLAVVKAGDCKSPSGQGLRNGFQRAGFVSEDPSISVLGSG